MLYLVATPIGNLEDITFRAVATLKKCDYVLAEDTRQSLKLLNHYECQKPLFSFHQHNEQELVDKVINDLQKGLQIALVSDAGTPLISDPGFLLVKECQKHSITVTACPGPSSVVTALTLSGLNPTPFQFVGFLPRKSGDLQMRLEELLEYPGTSICFETAERIEETLTHLQQIDPECTVCVARELTKYYETVCTASSDELLKVQKKTPFRGEIVLLIQGYREPAEPIFSKEFLQFAVEDVSKTCSTKEAIAKVAKQLKIPKRLVYNAIHK